MEISGTITIAASAARVWAILTDFAAYAHWNPFLEEPPSPPSPGHG